MNFTQQDFSEVPQLVKLLAKIEHIDLAYVNKISEEIFQQQPFFLTILLGYRLDTSLVELEEIMKTYLLIWEFFKQNRSIPTEKITETYFEELQNKNTQLLKYVEGEPDDSEKQKIYSDDLQSLKSKALLTVAFFRCNNNPVLSKMEDEKKALF